MDTLHDTGVGITPEHIHNARMAGGDFQFLST